MIFFVSLIKTFKELAITKSSAKMDVLPIYNIHNKLQLFLAGPINNTRGGVSILYKCFVFAAAALIINDFLP